jgi:cytochrome c oxidase assembly protein subunit 15
MISMAPASNIASADARVVRLWLLLVAALVFATLVIGGATRLTGSGLSITEWKPVTGVVPPLTEHAWQAEFDKYKSIPQYRERNLGMSLEEFKIIYWWEWTHRMMARLVGAAFILPLIWFALRRRISPELRLRLIAIGGLGAALGGIGWWMVSSGLADRVSVSQYRLAFHMTLACGIFSALLWTAEDLAPRLPVALPQRIRITAVAILVLVLLQIYLGALVSGLHAGLLFNTWPLIDGQLIPDPARLFFEHPLWRNFFENALTVQFDHRMLAYGLFILTVIHAADVARTGRRAATLGFVLAAVMTLQAALGILTLLFQAPLVLALSHQAMAIVVLALAVLHAHRCTSHALVAKDPAVVLPQEQAP